MTAIRLVGLFFISLKEISANNFLGLSSLKKIIFLSLNLIFFFEIIIFAPLFIASKIYLFPSNLVPSIAKKILSFLTCLLLKATPEKYVL